MKLKSLTTLLIMAASASSIAATPATGWYAGILASVAQRNSVDFLSLSPTAPYPTVDTQYRYSVGGGAGLSLGYRFSQFRTEGEFVYHTNGISKVISDGETITKNADKNINGYTNKGRSDMYGLMLNAYYDLYSQETDVNFVPYVGLGVGTGKLRINNKFYASDSTQITDADYKDNKNKTLGQVILGFAYYIDDYTTMGLDYRYINSIRNKTTTTDSTTFATDKFKENTINLVFNFNFDNV